MQFKPSNTAYLTLFERQQEMFGQMVSEYRSGKHPSLPWRTVPADRLVRIWEATAKDGFVRDTKGLERIEEIFIENVLRLAVNNEISGHSEVTAEEDLAEHFEKDEVEAFVEWAIEAANGWRISDYGMDDLFRYAALLLDTDGHDQKLVILDLMLNVTHQRSDLASWFVEGGTRTLIRLHEGSRPSERNSAAPAFG